MNHSKSRYPSCASIIGITLVLTLIILSFILQNNILRFIPVSLSGLIIGLYYGMYNHEIFHNDTIKRDSLNEYVKTNQLWIHILCGLTGAATFYMLLPSLDFLHPENIKNLGVTQGILFLISILSYSGLLPRTLWFGRIPK